MIEPDFKSEGKLLAKALGANEINLETTCILVLKTMWERGVIAGMERIGTAEKKLPYEAPSLTYIGNLFDKKT